MKNTFIKFQPVYLGHSPFGLQWLQSFGLFQSFCKSQSWLQRWGVFVSINIYLWLLISAQSINNGGLAILFWIFYCYWCDFALFHEREIVYELVGVRWMNRRPAVRDSDCLEGSISIHILRTDPPYAQLLIHNYDCLVFRMCQCRHKVGIISLFSSARHTS